MLKKLREILSMKNEVKAVSTILTILLVFVSLIFGAAIGYMWVMANFYNVPENTTLLLVEDLTFPWGNFSYFNVTILNPSYSLSDVNLTAFRVGVEGKDETYAIERAEPSLPLIVRIGTRQSFICLENWSHLAGETVRIEPVTENASVRSHTYITPNVRLNILPSLNVSDSVQRFNLTVENPSDSVMNLTISSISVSGVFVTTDPPLSNVSALKPGETQAFLCHWNWEDKQGQEATITVVTAEGFEQNYTTKPLAGAFLRIDDIEFDYTDTSYFNITIKSLDSTATVWLDRVNLTLQDNTTITLDTAPSLELLAIPVPANETMSLKCLWDWSAHRSETITINVYTKQGFTIQSRTTMTPPAVIWEVDNVSFDLNDLQHFSVNVTNFAPSLQEINVTKVQFNQNVTSMIPTPVASGSQAEVECGFDWTSFVGENATITVQITYGLNESSISKDVTLSAIQIENVFFASFSTGNPYFNVTIVDSQFSKHDSNITQLLVRIDNSTFAVDGTITSPKVGPAGYSLAIGAEVTIICPWDWTQHVGKDATIIVQTAEGIQISTTLKVE